MTRSEELTLTDLFGWFIELHKDEVDCKLCGARVVKHRLHWEWHIRQGERL